MIFKLLTEHLEFLSLKGGCRGSSESTHVKMPHCRKSHALAQLSLYDDWQCQSSRANKYKIRQFGFKRQLFLVLLTEDIQI